MINKSSTKKMGLKSTKHINFNSALKISKTPQTQIKQKFQKPSVCRTPNPKAKKAKVDFNSLFNMYLFKNVY